MSALENEFGVQISNGDAQEIRNGKDVLAAIELARQRKYSASPTALI
ncbi:hypothetical protein [Streptomyces sp. NBC_00878]|nr:hypothetical protein [Streptomyces sp. NBC_00878]MCX4902754.1 hypothetical protein [Streptomyces sp. NBC_00878]